MIPPGASAARRAPPAATATAVGVLGIALVTWIVLLARMRGMDAGPGTDLGGLGWFLGVWVTMMAAMMLPSAVPAVAAVHRAAGPRTATPWLFVCGYLVAWTAAGLAAYAADRAVRSIAPGFMAWDRQGPVVAGIAIALAGLYQTTPLKRVCLRRCRAPMRFLMTRWRLGAGGAVAMGAEHGAWCLGCCLGLMVVLFALGVMSITWMAVVAAVIFAEKVLPWGTASSLAAAACLVALGVWVAAAPASVPGLTQPDRAAMEGTTP